MPVRNDRTAAWFRLPVGFARDAKLMRVPPATRYLFLEFVALAVETLSQGRVDAVQLSSCGHGMRALRAHCGLLMDAELLSYDQEEDAYYILDVPKWLGTRQEGDPKPVTKATSAKRVPAGQRANERPERENVRNPPVAHGGARVKKEREKEREEERTPSGSVRSSSAQAAPRGTGGATQPAPVVEIPEGGRLSGAEARAAIRQTLNNAKQTVSGSTGRDAKFSKYDPDRPIEPINSAFGSGGDAE